MAATGSSGRALTAAEIDLCEEVFGNTIVYGAVRIFNRKWWLLQPRRVTMAPDGNIWFHPAGNLYREDFAQASLTLQGLLIHEMVHVWQHQQGVFLPLARHPFCSYKYELDPGKPFDDYGIEQQAEIVRHQFLQSRGMQLKDVPPVEQLAGLLPFKQTDLVGSASRFA